MAHTVETLECDYCIAGTGASGGILAYRLAQAGKQVISLEQGPTIADSYFTNELRPEQEANFGISPDMPWDLDPAQSFYFSNAKAHQLYARDDELATSPNSKDQFVNLQINRLNGKLNLWNAVALRYARRDFRPKDFGEPGVNWPIDYDDLEEHYTAVERLIGVCGTREGLEELPDGDFLPPLPLRPADHILLRALRNIRDVKIRAIPVRKAIETRPERANHCRNSGDCIFGCAAGSVYKFSSHLLPRIARRSNFRLMCQLKLTRLIRSASSDQVEAAECLDLATGKTLRVKARIFILACGAMDTPRILFNSHDERFPQGLANDSGLVGCYLQEHRQGDPGHFTPALDRLPTALRHRHQRRLVDPAVYFRQASLPRWLSGAIQSFPADTSLLSVGPGIIACLAQKARRTPALQDLCGHLVFRQTGSVPVEPFDAQFAL